MNTTYISQEHLEELQEELSSLKKKRREVAEKLKQAKEEGDLSENFSYTAAREDQDRLERRIFELEELLKSASIIEKGPVRDTVQIGSTVTVKKDGKKMQYAIVGTNEANPRENKISNESPLGRALVGRKKGDAVTVETPAGAVEYKVLKIE